MAGALRKTMVYLGLAEEDYDGEDGYDDERSPAEERRDSRSEQRPESGSTGREDRRAQVTPISRDARVARVVPEPVATDLRRITTVHPRTYNEAKTIGESFRDGVPVIMNLTDMDDADAKRLVDFSAGLIFGLRGSIERVTSKVFLLSPAHVEVTAERAKVAPPTPGFFNQS